MNLYLVRHGEAEAEHIDPKHPLTQKGREDVRKVAHQLKERNISVPVIYHSGKKRAEETAQIIAQTINPECRLVKKNNLSPNDAIEPMVQEIQQLTQDCMIVGHLPFVSKLASQILCGHEERKVIPFRAGCAAILTREKEECWELKEIISPFM
ncbi:MAG: phosphohistidine phosphatase SixA [Candidatus Omnitrophota bacterium]